MTDHIFVSEFDLKISKSLRNLCVESELFKGLGGLIIVKIMLPFTM